MPFCCRPLCRARRVVGRAALGAAPPIVPPAVRARRTTPSRAAVEAAMWAAQYLPAAILPHSAHRTTYLKVRGHQIMVAV
eukprot:9085847-Lingulodinium_polyedra.AAC.1